MGSKYMGEVSAELAFFAASARTPESKLQEQIRVLGQQVDRMNGSVPLTQEDEHRYRLMLNYLRGMSRMPQPVATQAEAMQMALLMANKAARHAPEVSAIAADSYSKFFGGLATQAPETAAFLADMNVRAATANQFPSGVASSVLSSFAGRAFYMLRGDRKGAKGAQAVRKTGEILLHLVNNPVKISSDQRTHLCGELEKITDPIYQASPLARGIASFFTVMLSEDILQKNRALLHFEALQKRLDSPLEPNGLTAKPDAEAALDKSLARELRSYVLRVDHQNMPVALKAIVQQTQAEATTAAKQRPPVSLLMLGVPPTRVMGRLTGGAFVGPCAACAYYSVSPTIAGC